VLLDNLGPLSRSASIDAQALNGEGAQDALVKARRYFCSPSFVTKKVGEDEMSPRPRHDGLKW
jgi:hypothetical protein